MSKLIVIAGPQAAGKSSIIARLNQQNATWRRGKPLVFILQESRQIVAHKNISLGAIFMKPEEECEVAMCDLSRMDLILKREHDRIVFIDECNIFTIAHAHAHGILDIRQYYDAYLTRLKSLKAAIIFLDVPPEVSWKRRRGSYEKRLIYFPKREHSTIMERYRDYLTRMHPLLLSMYQQIPLPKIKISGTLPSREVAKKVQEALRELSYDFR